MVDGFAILQQKLNALRTKELRKTQRKALKAVGAYVEGEMKERAPVKAQSARGILQPNELKESIQSRVSVPSDDGIVGGKTARVTIGPTGKEVKIIAHDVEYGHANPTANRKGKLKETPPHPFIRPTAEATQARAVQIYQSVAIPEVVKAMKS